MKRSFAVLQLCSHAVLQSCSHAVMQSCSHAVMQSCSLAVVQSELVTSHIAPFSLLPTSYSPLPSPQSLFEILVQPCKKLPLPENTVLWF
jgi:hypothetical protein